MFVKYIYIYILPICGGRDLISFLCTFRTCSKDKAPISDGNATIWLSSKCNCCSSVSAAISGGTTRIAFVRSASVVSLLSWVICSGISVTPHLNRKKEGKKKEKKKQWLKC